MTRRRALVLAVAVLAAGCGVPDQAEPDVVDPPDPPSVTPTVAGDLPRPTTTTTTTAPPTTSSTGSPTTPPGPSQ